MARTVGEAPRGLVLALVALLIPAPAALLAGAAGDAPWRAGEAVDAPAWLELSGSYRARYEALSSHLRSGVEGSDEILVGRLLLAARLGGDDLFGKVELQDSRAWRDDRDTPLGTDDVNAAELLQAHVGFGLSDALSPGDRLGVEAGRMTLDLGSRRLLARNRFRNTLNAFTGVHAAWRGPGAPGEAVEARAFFLLPVTRRPTGREALDDNDAALDREGWDLRFWGLHWADPALVAGLRGELYLLGLEEEDRPGAATRDRDLLTVGARLARPPARDRWDFDVETALQVGDTRASAAPAAAELDHRAWFAHLDVGRTLESPGAPRIVLQYDHASGDDLPEDDESHRFDTLFGARRFELGPTGIFGLLARGNLRSPGGRVELSPRTGWSLMAAYRAAWLASADDALVTTGARSPDGSTDFVGHLVETRLRVPLVPGNLNLELGGAHLFAGDLLTSQTPPVGDATYGYVQTTVLF
jgi:hypothetical protein